MEMRQTIRSGLKCTIPETLRVTLLIRSKYCGVKGLLDPSIRSSPSLEVTELNFEVSLDLRGHLEAETAKKKKVTNRIPKFENDKCQCLRGILVRVSDIGSKDPEFNPRLQRGKLFFSFILISRKI